MISEDDYDEIEKDLTPAQKVLIGDTAKALPFTAREKVAVAEKVRFTKNWYKLFPKADAFFENDNRKPFDDAEMIWYEESVSRPKMTIPQTQVMFEELNEGKLPEQLKFFSSGSSGRSGLKIRAIQKIGSLNESNNAFLEYLTTDYGSEVLAKNKMKIHLETGNIYYNNKNMQERIYDFLLAQQDETKKTYVL